MEDIPVVRKHRALIIAGILLGVTLIGLLLFRIMFVDFVDRHEIGFKYDRRTGEITRLARTGYFITPPFVVEIGKIDTRPMQVCINANSRVLNCKLVRFNPAGLDLFITWHGRNPGSVEEILKSYAYDGLGRQYPFLDVMTELKASGGEINVAPAS